MMPRADVLEAVQEVFSTQLSLASIEESTHLFRDLKLDSLQQLTLVVEIENRFKICFEPSDEETLETVSDVIDRIEQHLLKANQAPALGEPKNPGSS